MVITITTKGQLITNGDMEIGDGGLKSVPNGWEVISGTPDHCDSGPNTCSPLSYKIPQPSPQGGKWVRFFHGNVLQGLNNEVFGQTLTSPLVVGQSYTLSFYAAYSRANQNATATTASIVAGLSKGKPSGVGPFLQDTLLLQLEDQWTCHSYTFTATDNYDFISFGKLEIELNNACYIDQVQLEKSLSLELGSDTTLCLEEALQLSASNPGATYLWSDQSQSSSLYVLHSGTYWVEVERGCEILTDTIEVLFRNCNCSFYVPNIFTPNGDHHNDQFSPVFNCQVNDYRLMIFDRWGNNVFHSNKPNESWDGNFRNLAMPNGVYIYQLMYSYEGQSPIFQYGSVQVIR